MKKTSRNQNMPDQRLRSDESLNTSSLPLDRQKKPVERFSDANLTKKGRNQRYDDLTGTVENGIG